MRKLKCGLIQMGLKGDVSMRPEQIRERMLEAHVQVVRLILGSVGCDADEAVRTLRRANA
jgi:hypothetical protein